MKIDKIIIVIINILFYIGVIAAVLYFVAGFRYINAGNSLLDQVDKRSIIVMKTVKADDIKNNQVVAYGSEELNIYKVISNTNTDVKLTNNGETISVSKSEVEYIMLFAVPYLGMIISFLMTKNGIITILILVTIYFILKKLVFKK